MDVFYRLNPRLLERYQPFMTATLKQRRENSSETGWTNGLYVAKAIGACMPKGKSYPSEPEKLWGNNEEINEEGEPFTDADRFGAFAMAFNAGFKKKSADTSDTELTE